ncbi:hypothetical protein [Paracoccus sp. R86501]|uniref:hypothetical protein n=1 Tax=Paracoccus sp. R86501 TaxID=3101711 RepID=UPI00366E98E2
MSQRPILVFDVNETLLDLDSLVPLFTRLFDNPAAMREWFAQLVLYSQTLSLARIESDFAKLAAGVLRMQGQIHNRHITDADVAQLFDGHRQHACPPRRGPSPANPSERGISDGHPDEFPQG